MTKPTFGSSRASEKQQESSAMVRVVNAFLELGRSIVIFAIEPESPLW